MMWFCLLELFQKHTITYSLSLFLFIDRLIELPPVVQCETAEWFFLSNTLYYYAAFKCKQTLYAVKNDVIKLVNSMSIFFPKWITI